MGHRIDPENKFLRVSGFCCVNKGMNDNAFDTSIAACRDRPIPQAPQNLQANVLRRIRNRTDDLARSASTWFDAILTPWAATALFALVLFATLSVSTLTTRSNTRSERYEIAAQTLHFNTFAPSEVIDFSK